MTRTPRSASADRERERERERGRKAMTECDSCGATLTNPAPTQQLCSECRAATITAADPLPGAVRGSIRELLASLPDWQNQAACNGIDPELFFPERGASTADAKAVCRHCPVREECLLYAIELPEKFGIWGGRSERERRRMRRAMNKRGAA